MARADQENNEDDYGQEERAQDLLAGGFHRAISVTTVEPKWSRRRAAATRDAPAIG